MKNFVQNEKSIDFWRKHISNCKKKWKECNEIRQKNIIDLWKKKFRIIKKNEKNLMKYYKKKFGLNTNKKNKMKYYKKKVIEFWKKFNYKKTWQKCNEILPIKNHWFLKKKIRITKKIKKQGRNEILPGILFCLRMPYITLI